jgi:hypothetical protein
MGVNEHASFASSRLRVNCRETWQIVIARLGDLGNFFRFLRRGDSSFRLACFGGVSRVALGKISCRFRRSHTP